MRNFIYFFQFIFIIFLFFIFKLIGIKFSRILSGYIFKILGPIFRSNSLAKKNIQYAVGNFNKKEMKNIIQKMWINYGKIFSEYMFLKYFRFSSDFHKNIIVENKKILIDIKNSKIPVIFVSGHFDNFELMAMEIEKSGVKLATVYRPLNNIFLNPIMEKLRKNFICKMQIKKGIGGTKELLRLFKDKTSIALMIDQRVSEGIKINFFNNIASTTSIPAQFSKKFGAKIVPVHIERKNYDIFKIKFCTPISFNKNDSIEFITLSLNKILEKMILKNLDQWIWTHNRWK